MVNKIKAQNDVGILFFNSPLLANHANNLIQITDPEYPSFVFAKWKMLNRQMPNRHNSPGMDILYGSHIISNHSKQQYELSLYIMPETIPMDFLITQLEMPTSVDGVIVMIETTPRFIKKRTDTSWANLLSKYRGDLNRSPITWARMNNLPFTVVLIKDPQEISMISVDDLIKIYDLNQDTPIITCSPELNKESVDEILSTSLNQIKPNTSSNIS